MYIKKNTSRNNSREFQKEIEGQVQGHRDGHGFVLRSDGQSDIYLPPNEMRAVLHQDKVRVRIIGQDRKGRPEGHVLEIVERPVKQLIGRLLQESGVWLLAPEDKRFGQDVLLPQGPGEGKSGQVVVVALTEAPALYGQPVGKVIEVLGEVDDPGMEIEIAVRKYSVPHVFSADCLAAAEALPDKVLAKDRKGRVDLRDVPLVTIDGEDARDFDDAVYCESAKIGRAKGWRLLVAIADVSHYVQNGNAIDVDAYDRATSVYFPRRVIPMLPEKLSNGLCSLNPKVDRLCLVCDMLITADGDLHAYQFYPAVMNSHARLTYTEVAAILSNTRGPEAAQRADLVPHLLDLHGVYSALLKAREARGAVDFDTVETKIVSDEAGRIEKIVPSQRTLAHRLIEECMLAANVSAGDFILHNQRLALFRVHEKPSIEKIEILRAYLKALAIPASISDHPTAAEFQAIAKATHDRPDALQVHTMLLRSMMQAMYTPENIGHFGLAYEAYTHFTSPIRRYPDLLLHRVIKAILADKPYTLPALPTPGEAQAKLAKRLAERVTAPQSAQATRSRVAQAQMQGWEAAGLHCSANERRADEASRDVEVWLKCKYMRDYLGEEFSGTVSAVTSFGLFVTLETMYVEGLVHISELGGDYYRFDEMRQELRGERTGVRYAIGTRMQVQVSRVDLDARRIDFCLVQEESKEGKEGKDLAAAPLPQRGPGRSRAARRTAALLQQQEQREQEEVGAFIPDARPEAPTFGKVGKAEQRVPSGAKTASTHKAVGAQAVKASKASAKATKGKSLSRASGQAKAAKDAASSKKLK